jgi:hypothetical protein
MMLHAWQGPVQAVLQQTPLAQNPEAHWPAMLQALPLGRPPLTQVPFWQENPDWHSALLVQLVRQAPF